MAHERRGLTSPSVCMTLAVEDVRSILREQFPTLQARSIAWLGEGYDSVSFSVDDEWVFRFPKREDVERQLLRELRVLPGIAARSPVAVPEYRFAGVPSALFPRHFGGYRKLPGVAAHLLTLDPRQFARVLSRVGRFLTVLHACDASALGGDLPVLPVGEVLRDMQAEALDDLRNLEEVSSTGVAARWQTYLEQRPPSDTPAGPAVVVHGDLAAEHILVDPASGEVTGVIDWSEVALSSAAVDLAALFHWSGAETALQHYDHPVPDAILRQARFIAVCRAVLDVTFGLETGRAEYIAGALRILNDR
jgi:aminoglycoside phosphotransferase (APT) family kinase protein